MMTAHSRIALRLNEIVDEHVIEIFEQLKAHDLPPPFFADDHLWLATGTWEINKFDCSADEIVVELQLVWQNAKGERQVYPGSTTNLGHPKGFGPQFSLPYTFKLKRPMFQQKEYFWLIPMSASDLFDAGDRIKTKLMESGYIAKN